MIRKKLLSAAALMGALCTAAEAQEAFKSLAAGAEIGTTGAGIELSMPVYKDLLVVKAGVNFPSVSVNVNTSVDGIGTDINDQINQINEKLDTYGKPKLEGFNFNDDVQLTASPKLNLTTLKALLEVYPFRNSSFHVTAGAYFGLSGNGLVSADIYTDSGFWKNFRDLQKKVQDLNEEYKNDVPGYEPVKVDDIDFNVFGKTLRVNEKDGKGHVDARFDVWTVRPYIGVGFGRSLPKNHFGVQFDLGVWYHGTPVMASNSEVKFNSNAETVLESMPKNLEKISVWPQMSVRLVYRIF